MPNDRVGDTKMYRQLVPPINYAPKRTNVARETFEV